MLWRSFVLQRFMYSKNQILPELLSQYYRGVQLEYLLTMPQVPSSWNKVDFRTYQNICVAGSTINAQVLKLQSGMYFVPVVKSVTSDSQYKIVIPHKCYLDYFLVIFNKVFNRQKRTSTLVTLMITDLVPAYLSNEMIYQVSSKTRIVVIPPQKFLEDLLAISNTFKKRFMRTELSQVMSNIEVDDYKDSGVSIGDLQRKLNPDRDINPIKNDICGIVEVRHKGVSTFESRKSKSLTMNLYQSEVKDGSSFIGMYTVKVMYYYQQEEELFQKIKDWNTVMIRNAQRLFQKDGNFKYHVEDIDTIKLVDQRPWRYANQIKRLSQTNLVYSSLEDLKRPVIIRNLIKLVVELVRIECIKLSFECKQCLHFLKDNSCQKCGCKGQLSIWMYCEVQDQSCSGYLSIADGQAAGFLDLDAADLLALQSFCLVSGGEAMISPKTDIDVKIIKKLQYKMRNKLIQKVVLGTPYIDIRKTSRTKKQAQSHLQKQLGIQALEQKRLNVNGAIDKKGNIQFWIGAIKVHYVYDVEY